MIPASRRSERSAAAFGADCRDGVPVRGVLNGRVRIRPGRQLFAPDHRYNRASDELGRDDRVDVDARQCAGRHSWIESLLWVLDDRRPSAALIKASPAAPSSRVPDSTTPITRPSSAASRSEQDIDRGAMPVLARPDRQPDAAVFDLEVTVGRRDEDLRGLSCSPSVAG